MSTPDGFLPAAAVERMLAECRVTSVTAVFTVDPASSPAGSTDPIVIRMEVSASQLRASMRYDYLPDVAGPHADGPIEICPKHEQVLEIRLRPDPRPNLEAPVQLSWRPLGEVPVTALAAAKAARHAAGWGDEYTWDTIAEAALKAALPAMTGHASAVDVPALVRDHVKLGNELRELTRIHELLLGEVLKHADEDVNGGEEAAEYLAEHYVRFLEGQVADYQQRLRAMDQAYTRVRTELDHAHGMAAGPGAEAPAMPERNATLERKMADGWGDKPAT